MQLNQTKTKAMIVIYTKKYQFTSRLELKGQNVEIVKKMKTLSGTVTNKLN